MKDFYLDFETYSECDLLVHGAWVYSRHPSTRVLCMAYAFGDDKVELLTDKRQIENTLEGVIFGVELGYEFTGPLSLHAFNSFFECCIIANVLELPINFNQWHDTMALCNANGLPGDLDRAGQSILTHKKELKMKSGKALIRELCKPQKVGRGDKAKLVSPEERWGKKEYAKKIKKLGKYCKRDVAADRALSNILMPLSDVERQVWIEDQKINWRGMHCDVAYAQNAYALYSAERDKELMEVQRITGIDNPNSNQQVTHWLEKHEVTVPNMQAATVTAMLDSGTLTPLQRTVLLLRQTSSRTPPAKYLKMLAMADREDHRIRGMFTYQAAGPGRWASRGVNTQNLPRPDFGDYETPVELINDGDAQGIRALYGSVINLTCGGIRPALTATPGNRLIVCDFASVESRKLNWLAGNEKALKEIKKADKRGDKSVVYKIAASDVFGLPVADVKKGTPEYQGGKAVVLACGYQGGYRALQKTAENAGIEIIVPKSFKQPAWMKEKIKNENIQRRKNKEGPLDKSMKYAMFIVYTWRNANPEIVQFWYDCGDAAIAAVKSPGQVQRVGEVAFLAGKHNGVPFLWCELPSGRVISYLRPHLGKGKFGEQLQYYGIDSTTRQFTVISTYGGKLVENITQGSARDQLAEGMLNVRGTEYDNIVLHVHDELVCDVPKGVGSPQGLADLMCKRPTWAKGLPISASAEELERYWK